MIEYPRVLLLSSLLAGACAFTASHGAHAAKDNQPGTTRSGAKHLLRVSLRTIIPTDLKITWRGGYRAGAFADGRSIQDRSGHSVANESVIPHSGAHIIDLNGGLRFMHAHGAWIAQSTYALAPDFAPKKYGNRAAAARDLRRALREGLTFHQLAGTTLADLVTAAKNTKSRVLGSPSPAQHAAIVEGIAQLVKTKAGMGAADPKRIKLIDISGGIGRVPGRGAGSSAEQNYEEYRIATAGRTATVRVYQGDYTWNNIHLTWE